MKKIFKAMILITTISFTACGSISSAVQQAISALTSTDCDSWILDEISSDLSEDCRNLANYLPGDSSSLAGNLGQGLSQALPINDLVTTGLGFIQLTDSNGDPLTALNPEDISLSVSTDGGSSFTDIESPVSVTSLENAQTLQSSIMMVLDYSASILDNDLNDINSGLNLFYDNIFSDTVSQTYQSAIIKFSTDVTLIQDFTQTKSLLTTAVDDTSYTRESTSLYDAIYDAVNETKDTATPLRMVIVFTDGVDNDSTHTKSEVISLAQQNKVPVCVVGVGFADVNTLEDIASDTGCFYIYKAFFTSLDDAFTTLAEQINGIQIIELPNSFNDAEGILKMTIDAGESTSREILQQF